ncbi:MAG: heavy metal translocating P-type ATPase [Planctomycetota bacterium]|nr:MAG: heavy metal translocating P-type ATPase [Planctomycetota bacterium]
MSAPEPTSGTGSIRIAVLAAAAIVISLILQYLGLDAVVWKWTVFEWPLIMALILGGLPLVWELLDGALHGEFGSDLLAGISIVTSLLVGEPLAGVIVVLMLSGGQVLESYAIRRASSALELLARRMPLYAHRREGTATIDIAIDQIQIGDQLVVFPHETSPVDGTVVDGHGSMDESYLTGEPYQVDKAPGARIISGAINGHTALTIRADRRAVDSRYAKIMDVMRAAENRRPRMRRLADQLGTIYTPLAVLMAVAAGVLSNDSRRFLAVLVTATPCPLLIAIPVAILGGISLCARRGIVIRDPGVLERIDTCQVAIFDKTGTLTYGRPHLEAVVPIPSITSEQLIGWTASLERYSKHPLAEAVVQAARGRRVLLSQADEVSELPGQGLLGKIAGRTVRVTSRKKLLLQQPEAAPLLPPPASGLECVILVDEHYAGTLRFRDEPRPDGRSFIGHLAPQHRFQRVMLVSGDRIEEVDYLARQVGITEVLASQTPEQKLELVREITRTKSTLFMGDGINDAPALSAATVGVAFGAQNEITSEAAGAVILESSLVKVDELLHIGQRMKRIALESAGIGIGLSLTAMVFAALGYITPVTGALIQEAIDVLAVLNALRVPWQTQRLTDYPPSLQ